MTQSERILRALQRYPNGITQIDFLLPDVIDGGPPITRVAARVKDLRDEGHDITVAGERTSCTIYRLRPPAPCPPDALVDRDLSLWTERPAARNAIFDEDAA